MILLLRRWLAFGLLAFAPFGAQLAHAQLSIEIVGGAGVGSTFPQIFIGELHVGGCDELYALDREGRLDPLLAGEKANP